MSNLLNIFTIIVIFAYTVAFLNNAYQVICSYQNQETKDLTINDDDQGLVELKDLFDQVAEIGSTAGSTDSKPSFDSYTKAQMKKHIAENNLTEKIEAFIGFKLYKARKTEILVALEKAYA